MTSTNAAGRSVAGEATGCPDLGLGWLDFPDDVLALRPVSEDLDVVR